MKGYIISLSNELLEPKHYKNMGVSIWLYIWLLDKMTGIKPDGRGKVLGGKPIKHTDVMSELGISRHSYNRYIKILQDKGYVYITRTPYGLVVEIDKAKKYFGKTVRDSGTSGSANVAHLMRESGTSLRDSGTSVRESGTSNKTIQLDNTKTIQGGSPAFEGAGYKKAKKAAEAIKKHMPGQKVEILI